MGRFVEYTSPYGTEFELAFLKERYESNSGFAVEVACMEKGEDFWDLYGTLTVNLGPSTEEGTAYLDVNNMPDLVKFCKEQGWIADEIGKSHSGFVEYPLAEFSESFMNDILMTPEEFAAKSEARANAREETKAPIEGETLAEWVGRVASAETPDTILVYLPIPSRGLNKERPNQIARDLIERVFANEGIEVSDITIIPREDGHIMGTGAYVKVPIERYYDASALGWSIAREIKRANDSWSNVNIGNIGLEKKPSPSQASERKDVEMAEEVKREFANVEFPASCIKRGFKDEEGNFHEFVNKETGEKFCKCYFPEGMQVGGQDMTGYYLSPKPEFIKPSGFRLGAMQWGYKKDPEKTVWAFKDTKLEDGTYEKTHVELDPAKLEEACREFMEVPDNKEFIRVPASKVKEHVNGSTGRTFYSAKGPNLTVDGTDLSKYEFTANWHSQPKKVGEVDTVVFYAVKGEQVKMNPPAGIKDAKPAYMPSETVAKGFNAEINRLNEKKQGAPAHAKETPAPAQAEPAREIAPAQVAPTPKPVR